MAAKDCHVKDIRFVSEKLNLPMLLNSRNRIKFDPFHTVPNYIKKKRNFYTQDCYSEELKTNKNREVFKRLMNKNAAKDDSCHKSPNSKRQPLYKSENNPPPNIYNTMYEPYSSRRGLGGAFWKKLKENIILNEKQLKAKRLAAASKPKDIWKFYDVTNSVDRLLSTSNKHRGKFLSNPRKRPATTRCMVTDPCLIYRSPKEPSPAQYNVKLHTIAYNLAPRRRHKADNPHLFPRGSCVPEYPSKLIPRHLSFLPAVGRYEIRYPKHCPCGRKIFTPGLGLIVADEKRKQLRHLPYERIKLNLHCDPDWDHVIGRGHKHIFRLPNAKVRQPKPAEFKREFQKFLHKFPDLKYIQMMTAPNRPSITSRYSFSVLEPRVRFSCIFKHSERRVMRIDRKVGFGGAAKRFSEFFPTILTHDKLKKLIENLPTERKLQNQPVTRASITTIQPRIADIPQHMKANYTPNLRKTFFKFPPLPKPKLLVSKVDLLPDLAPNEVYKTPRAFNTPIDLNDFIDQIPDKAQSIVDLEQSSDVGAD